MARLRRRGVEERRSAREPRFGKGAASLASVVFLRSTTLAIALAACLGCAPTGGRLALAVVDAATGEPTPARVEILDEAGGAHVADGALEVAGDCGWLPVHNWLPPVAQIQMWRALAAPVANPFTGTTQFYVDRPLSFELPPGRYRVRVFKGMEHRVAAREVDVGLGEDVELSIPLERWVDLSAEGWHGADDHLHIARPHRRFDRSIARWMQAEDLDVANLLQMGLAQELYITPQHGFGEPSVHEDSGTFIASGQENPRTHVLGHAITLGAGRWIDFPEGYLDYGRFWREARRLGGINGFAHWGLGGADEGLAAWAPERLLDFLEVLGFGLPYYGLWYDLLDLGIRVAPTAGTDYPCAPSLPGRERFYARLDGPLAYRDWLGAVAAGRTFVTNGPALELTVGGAGIGDELELEAPGEVVVRARARFDPERDDVARLELIRAGEAVAAVVERPRPGEIALKTTLAVEESAWLALRATGSKLGETPVAGIEHLEAALTFLERATADELLRGPDRALPRNGDPRPSAAHTAPVWVTVAGTPAIEEQPAAAEAAERFLALLAELEARFDDDRIEEMAGFPGRGDGVSLEDLQAGRPAVLESVAKARAYYERLVSPTEGAAEASSRP